MVLKAVYFLKFEDEPPRIHDLLTLGKIVNLNASEEIEDFIRNFSAISVRARYPEDLNLSLKEYDKKKTAVVLDNTRKVLEWLGKQLNQK